VFSVLLEKNIKNKIEELALGIKTITGRVSSINKFYTKYKL